MPFQSITKTCAHCGTPFVIDAARIKNQIYCSKVCYHSHPMKPVAERFWKKVDVRGPDDCWPWMGFIAPNGYGKVNVDHEPFLTHRLAYKLDKGSVDPNLLVLHSCDVRYPPGDISYRSCCNPAHLSQGTHKENSEQMVERGRAATGDRSTVRLHPEIIRRGEQNKSAKLTAEKVRAMRREYAAGRTSFRLLGLKYGISAGNARMAVHKISWAHIT